MYRNMKPYWCRHATIRLKAKSVKTVYFALYCFIHKTIARDKTCIKAKLHIFSISASNRLGNIAFIPTTYINSPTSETKVGD